MSAVNAIGDRACVGVAVDIDDVSRLVKQARAMADLLRNCAEDSTIALPGTSRETLQNGLWAIDDLLGLAIQALLGKELPFLD